MTALHTPLRRAWLPHDECKMTDLDRSIIEGRLSRLSAAMWHMLPDEIALATSSAEEDYREIAAPARLYGVSSGDGNNGVSHTFPDYYVRTNDPWRLARLACMTSMKPDWHDWALEEMQVDGESDYGISAVLYEPPDWEPEDEDAAEEGYGPAWLIIEVFPEDEPRDGVMIYDSLHDAFSAADLARVPRKD